MKKIQAETREIILRLVKKYPSVRIIDPYHVACHDNRCVAALGQIPLYNTNGPNSHLNHAGSTLLGDRYLQQQHVGNPFA